MSTDDRAVQARAHRLNVLGMVVGHVDRARETISGWVRVSRSELSMIEAELAQPTPETAQREQRAADIRALLDYATMTGEHRIREAADWLARLPLSGGGEGAGSDVASAGDQARRAVEKPRFLS